MKAFVDYQDDNGVWHYGGIAMPHDEALDVAAELREQNPGWLVEVNPLEGTP